MKTVICSHGFGVKADARGMFPEIAGELPDFNFFTFDYNEIKDNDVIVHSLERQAVKLQQAINDSPKGSVLLCHSQGCIVAGLVDLSTISKVILLAPPVKMSMQRVLEKLMKKPGSVIDLDGESQLPRSDGTITYLTKEYIKSVDNHDPMMIYRSIAENTPTVIVRALDDEVLGITNVDEIQQAELIDIVADHDFTDSARKELIDTIGWVLDS